MTGSFEKMRYNENTIQFAAQP